MIFPVLKFNNHKYIGQPKLLQSLKNGQLFEYVGIEKNLQISSKFINKKEHFHWRYKFHVYTNPIKKFYIEIDYYDKVIDAKYYKE